MNCKELSELCETRWQEGERPWHQLFCPRALASPVFELLWANAEFAVLRLQVGLPSSISVLGKEPKAKGKSGRVEDLKTWEPMLKRCLREEPGECAARAADLALAFRKMGQPQVTNTLLRWAEEPLERSVGV